jgi:argininosuccinate lyase
VVNPQYAQNSRGKVEIMALSALSAATLDLRRLAWDFSLFSTAEFGYISIPDRYCTGSSIMPNKNNPDVVELLRAVNAVVVGAQAELNAIISLPSGYHRDLQSTKPPVMRAFTSGLQALNLLPELIGSFNWNEERLAAAMTPDLFATDLATDLAAQGVPFREAYRRVGDSLSELAESDPQKSLYKRVSKGGCADLGLDILQARLEDLWQKRGSVSG